MELFEARHKIAEPLAARMRPRVIDEYIGQEHIIGQGKLLRRLIQADRVSSLIFYGPPGTGKTTLASVIANTTKSRFVVLNAVLSGVKQLREALDDAAREQNLYGNKTILFVDEVHRWNKSQQDALLPWVENGTVVLIGATTENPYFEVNPALVSRSRIFRLKKMQSKEMIQVIKQTLDDTKRGYGTFDVHLDADAEAHLIKTADGDARNLLNALELAIETTPDQFPPERGSLINVNLKTAEESIQEKAVLYDKEGDFHYDIISAFIKSIRGSDPDAVLYWLSRMIQAGENPRFIFRRMLISACEDIGLADPNALRVVESAATSFDRVGLPEGRFMLSQAALYLATAEKSNSNLGLFDALSSVEKESSQDVPNHLKDAGRDSKSFGHGKGYLYPHAFRDHWTAQQYLPDGLQGRIFYHPSNQGYESEIRDKVLRNREIQLEKAVSHQFDENFSWTPDNFKQSEWIKRAEKGQSEKELVIRDALFSESSLRRHSNILVIEEKSALVYWEALRISPEGGIYLLSDSEKVSQHISHYFQENNIDDIPMVIRGNRQNLNELNVLVKKNTGLEFDFIVGRQLFSIQSDARMLLQNLKKIIAIEGEISFSQTDFLASSTLVSLLKGSDFPQQLLNRLVEVEDKMVTTVPAYLFDSQKVAQLAESAGMKLYKSEKLLFEHSIQITGDLIEQWLSLDRIGYGSFLFEAGEEIVEYQEALKKLLLNQTIKWKQVDYCYRLCHDKKPG